MLRIGRKLNLNPNEGLELGDVFLLEVDAGYGRLRGTGDPYLADSRIGRKHQETLADREIKGFGRDVYDIDAGELGKRAAHGHRWHDDASLEDRVLDLAADELDVGVRNLASTRRRDRWERWGSRPGYGFWERGDTPEGWSLGKLRPECAVLVNLNGRHLNTRVKARKEAPKRLGSGQGNITDGKSDSVLNP